jgi:hypothetical protein
MERLMRQLIALAAVILCGCSTSRYAKTTADGTKVTIFNSRFIWATEGFEAEFATNGSGRVKIAKSNPDAVTAAAITEAAVSAAISSASPIPTLPKAPAK